MNLTIKVHVRAPSNKNKIIRVLAIVFTLTEISLITLVLLLVLPNVQYEFSETSY